MLKDDNLDDVKPEQHHHDLIERYFSHLKSPQKSLEEHNDSNEVIPFEKVKSQGRRILGLGQLKPGEIYGFMAKNGRLRIFQMPSYEEYQPCFNGLQVNANYLDISKKEGLNGQGLERDTIVIHRNRELNNGVYHFNKNTSVGKTYLEKNDSNSSD